MLSGFMSRTRLISTNIREAVLLMAAYLYVSSSYREAPLKPSQFLTKSAFLPPVGNLVCSLLKRADRP